MPKIHLLLLLLLLILNVKAFSQIDEFSEWIGEWHALYDNNIKSKNDEGLTIKWAHLNRWLQFDIEGGTVDKQIKYSNTMVLTLDNNFDIVGWYISEGGYSSMATIKGVLEDGKLIIESKSQNWTGKSTWLVKDGKLHKKGKFKSLVTDETFSNEIIYNRKSDN